MGIFAAGFVAVIGTALTAVGAVAIGVIAGPPAGVAFAAEMMTHVASGTVVAAAVPAP